MSKNTFTFKELTEVAKEKALKDVIRYMNEEGPNYHEDHKLLAKMIEDKFKETQLKVEYIEWDSESGISLDDLQIKVTDNFLKKHLNQEEFCLYEEVYTANGGALAHRILHEEDDYGYAIEAEESMGYDVKDIMEFLLKYGSEEVKAKYKFPLLIENELSDEEFYHLYEDLDAISTEFFEKFKETLNPVANELARFVIDTNEKHLRYLGTEEYYLEKLNKENSFRFDFEGTLMKVE